MKGFSFFFFVKQHFTLWSALRSGCHNFVFWSSNFTISSKSSFRKFSTNVQSKKHSNGCSYLRGSAFSMQTAPPISGVWSWRATLGKTPDSWKCFDTVMLGITAESLMVNLLERKRWPDCFWLLLKMSDWKRNTVAVLNHQISTNYPPASVFLILLRWEIGIKSHHLNITTDILTLDDWSQTYPKKLNWFLCGHSRKPPAGPFKVKPCDFRRKWHNHSQKWEIEFPRHTKKAPRLRKHSPWSGMTSRSWSRCCSQTDTAESAIYYYFF